MSMILVAVLALGALQEPTPAPAAGEALRIQGDIKPPKKTKHVAPEYPEDALQAGLRGLVVLECAIDTEGKVDSLRVVKGVPPLTDAAMKAVKKWRYTPTLLNGTPVPVIMTVTVNFKRELHFRLPDLLDSLRSKNEFIRESAVNWLGGARSGPTLGPGEIAMISHELERLAQSDPSDRVREAAGQALARLQPK
jgi:TonB family protein